MNPKGVNNLDPKLRETYERVMGTTFRSSTPSEPQQPVAPQPKAPVFTTTPVSDPVSNPSLNTQPEMVQSPSFKTQDPFTDPPTPPSEVFSKSAPVNNPVPTVKKKNNLMPIVLIFGGLVFFVIYGAVWAKVFGLF